MPRKSKQPPPQGIDQLQQVVSRGVSVWQALAQVITSLVDNIGLPGTLVFALLLVIHLWASPEQKREIIDIYILGKGIARLWPHVIMALFFVSCLLGQRHYYLKKIKTMSKEIDRIGAEKSRLQEERAGRSLQHSKQKNDD
jgi:hypothetical protein